MIATSLERQLNADRRTLALLFFFFSCTALLRNIRLPPCPPQLPSHLAPETSLPLLLSPAPPFLLTLLCPLIPIRTPYLHTLPPSPPSRLLFTLQPSSLPHCSPPSHRFLLNFPFSPFNVLKNNRRRAAIFPPINTCALSFSFVVPSPLFQRSTGLLQ